MQCTLLDLWSLEMTDKEFSVQYLYFQFNGKPIESEYQNIIASQEYYSRKYKKYSESMVGELSDFIFGNRRALPALPHFLVSGTYWWQTTNNTLNTTIASELPISHNSGMCLWWNSPWRIWTEICRISWTCIESISDFSVVRQCIVLIVLIYATKIPWQRSSTLVKLLAIQIFEGLAFLASSIKEFIVDYQRLLSVIYYSIECIRTGFYLIYRILVELALELVQTLLNWVRFCVLMYWPNR